MKIPSAALGVVFLLAGFALAQYAPNRYMVILEDPPVSARFASRDAIRSVGAGSYRQQVEAVQRKVRAELATRNFRVTGSVSTLLNAVFVATPSSRVSELRSVPGVKGVVPVRRYKLKMNRAVPLMNVPAAWNLLGGAGNAGAGVKIAILDTGIDQTHPAFQDPALAMPSGYPICSGADCQFTSNKVIVARSYVSLLAAGSSPTDPAADSRPDDYSARDRGGHGTAVASCAAAANNSGGMVAFSGMAPKAYLGNYKIYGSPELNDNTTDQVMIQALEDALNDGMDIASLSSGGAALTGPLESGAICGNSPGVPCDPLAVAFENAAQAGMTVVVAAGNDGESAPAYPNFSSIETPADAPSVIAAGASTNSHYFLEAVLASGLSPIAANSGDAYAPNGALSAPLRDVTPLANDPLGCTTLPAGSLTGMFALIERGTCNFSQKAINALNAGAVGVIFYMADATAPIGPGGLSQFNAPMVMVANSDGLALKSFAAAHPSEAVTIDPSAIEQDSTSDQLAGFSSVGPATGNYAVKPELVAVGTWVYMAAEDYDPLGILFSSNRYAAANGTSFATPIVSGAAALVKQSHPGFSGAQIKSALVNTAAQTVTTDDSGNPVGVQSIGAGRLDAGAAAATAVTAVPATVSFGVLTSGSLPASRTIQITNSGASQVTLALGISGTNGAALALSQQSLTLGAGTSGAVAATLSGSVPAPGSYSGAITIQGTGVSLRVPYLYLVGSGVAANIVPLSGGGFDGTVNQPIPEGIISFKLTDAYGVPVANAPVSFTVQNGGTLQNADTATDANGVAAAEPILGAQPGSYSFAAVAGGLRTRFSGFARLQPAINTGGVVDSASSSPGRAVAPGSYISIYGTGLSDVTDVTSSSTLPLAIDYASVSFDVPSAHLSVPGHLVYVSPIQVNLQVPWELQGQSAAQVKVTIDYSNGNVVAVPIADYAPAFFEISPGTVAALDLSYAVIGSANPARLGQVVQLYANGLGPVTNPPVSGTPATSAPLSYTTTLPVVTIGGQNAPVLFSGLAPGFAGLYQINATVPENITAGQQTIRVSIGGLTSLASGIMVQ